MIESNSFHQNMLITILIVSIVALVLFACVFSLIIVLAQSNGLKFFKLKNKRNKKLKSMVEDYNFAKSLVNALTIMGNEKIGALIVVSRKDNIEPYTKNGYKINGLFSPEFTMSIFSNKKSALHDGAMIVENNRITTVSAYLPMTKNIIDIKYGARHRAALGMSEKTDAIVFVVSETTGLISIASHGVLTTLEKNNMVIEKRIFDILEINKIDIRD